MANVFTNEDFLRMWLRLENGALTVDDGDGVTMTNNNTVTADTTNYAEGAASGHFTRADDENLSLADASKSTNFPFNGAEENLTSFSIGFFIRLDTLATNYHPISVFDNATENAFLVFINDSNNIFSYPYDDAGATHGGLIGNLASADNWYFASASYFVQGSDDGYAFVGINSYLYDYDGTALVEEISRAFDSMTGDPYLKDSTASFVVGDSSAADRNFDGNIDSLLVFNRNIHQPEMIELMNGTYSGSDANYPRIQNCTWAETSNSTGMVMDMPPIVEDRFYLMKAWVDDNSGVFDTPTGWTYLTDEAHSSTAGGRMYLFYKVATGGEGATIAVNRNDAAGTQLNLGSITSYIQVDPDDPVDVYGTASGTSAAPESPTVTTTETNTAIVSILFMDNDELGTSSAAPLDSIPTIHLDSTLGNDGCHAEAYTIQESIGASGARAWDPDASNEYITATVALNVLAAETVTETTTIDGLIQSTVIGNTSIDAIISDGAAETQAIKVQRGITAIDEAGGTDTTFDEVDSLASSFALNKNNRYAHAGEVDLSASNRDGDDMSGMLELTATDTLTFSRIAASMAEDAQFAWEIWSYIGDPGGDNEFIVRSRNTFAFSSRTDSATLDTTPDNINDCVCFITGLMTTDNSDGSNNATAVAYLSGTETLNVERGGTIGTTTVQIVTVEFTGANWSVGHGDSGDQAGDTGTIDLFVNADGLTGGSYSVSDWSNAFIVGDDRGSTGDTDFALADMFPVYDPGTNPDEVDWSFDGNHASTNRHFVRVVENADMTVTRYQDTSSTAAESTVDITSAGLTDLTNAAIIGFSETSGTGVAYGRGWRNYGFNSLIEAWHWCHRSGNTMNHELQIISMPMDTGGATTVTVITDIDALIQQAGIARSSSIDGMIQKGYLETLSIDALIAALKSGTITLDSLIQAVKGQSVTIDALIQAALSGDLTIDALLQIVNTDRITLDALIVSAIEKTVSIDGLVRATKGRTVTLGALIQAALASDFSIDGLIQASQIDQTALDAIIQAVKTESASIDSLVMDTNYQAFSIDALITALFTQGLTLDALLQATIAGKTSIDAIIGSGVVTITERVTLDALLQAAKSVTLSLDAVISATQTSSLSLDAVLLATQINTFSISAMIQAAKTGSITIDALVVSVGTSTVSVDALIQAALTGAISLDALIKATNSQAMSIDARIWPNDFSLPAGQTLTASERDKLLVSIERDKECIAEERDKERISERRGKLLIARERDKLITS